LGLSDIAAERAVLAGLFKFGTNAFIEIDPLVKTSTFTLDSNQYIYECLKHLFVENQYETIDIPAIYSAAKEIGAYDYLNKDVERQYLKAVTCLDVKLDNLSRFATKIRKLEIARIYQDQLKSSIIELDNLVGNESLDTIINIAEKPITEITNSILIGTETVVPIGEGLAEYVQNIEDNPTEAIGIPSPFPKYNEAIGGGFRRKTLNLVAARLKTGKSMFGDNVALHVAGKLDIPVLYVDTEMNISDHWSRCLARMTLINSKDIETGGFAAVEFKRNKVWDAVNKLKEIPFDYMPVPGKSFEEILSIIRRWVKRRVGYDENGVTKNCLVIYDYIKMMSGDGLSNSLQEFQALGFLTSSLHDLCAQLDITMLAFAQENREGIDKATSATIGGSDRIAHLATSVCLFKSKTEEEINEYGPQFGNRKLHVIACRHGGGLDDNDYINMTFEGAHAHIKEGITRNQMAKERRKAEHEKQTIVVDDETKF